MKPRSSSPLIRRWMPDFERRLSASFISSKDGAIPVAASRWLMNISSSCCFFVSMRRSPRQGTNPKQQTLFYFGSRTTSSLARRARSILLSVRSRFRRGAGWRAMPRPIIIDTDPGIDDAVAILLALASPELEVLGLVAVAGNLPLAATATNARSIVELAGRPELPVYAGCPRPLGAQPDRRRGRAWQGRARRSRPAAARAAAAPRARRLLPDRRVARGPSRSSITLCALGPLTNIAMALVAAPEIAAGIAELVIMGGGSRGRQCDPGRRVQHPRRSRTPRRSCSTAALPITMVPLDVTEERAQHARSASRRSAPSAPRVRRRGRRAARPAARPRQAADGDARSLRHRLSARAGAVPRARGQCRDRDAEPADAGHDRHRLARASAGASPMPGSSKRSMPTGFTGSWPSASRACRERACAAGGGFSR